MKTAKVRVIRGTTDDNVEKIRDVLEVYGKDHPDAQIDLYRQNSVSVRVRIVDPNFKRMNLRQRSEQVWKYLDQLADEPVADISMLILLDPDEVESSMGNLEFEDPVPSDI